MLQKSDPLVDGKCKDERCMVCKTEKSMGCRTNGVTYEVECDKCNAKYVGETGRNAFARGLEHNTALQNKNENSILHIHTVNSHQNSPPPPKFNMRVTGVYTGDPMKRQIAEAIKISATKNSMNRKDEWRTVNFPRVESTVHH